MSRVGIVIANLGTPADPGIRAVRRYLREFLSDPCVIDIAQPWRWMLVNLVIAPFRAPSSSAMYRSIWTDEGSPLLLHSKRLADRLRAHLPDHDLRLAMRYGQPSLAEVLGGMYRDGLRRFLLSPQYPQYALATFESTVREARRVAGQLGPDVELDVFPAFWNREEYLNACAGAISAALAADPADHLVMSFHGVPVRHISRAGFGGPQCLRDPKCCSRIDRQNQRCYRAQCFATARELAARARLGPGTWSVAFQSRLKGSRWIGPYTDEVLLGLAARGVRRVSVVCPSFTVDCLETLEEVAERYDREFREAGGRRLALIPCLNDAPDWARSLAGMLSAHLQRRDAVAVA